MFVTSTDSKDVHPNNVFDNFIIDLPRPIDLRVGNDDSIEWGMALTDVAIVSNKGFSLHQTVVFMSDILESSHLRDRQIPLLRILPGALVSGTSLQIPYYMKLNTLCFNSIRIYLTDADLKPILTNKEDLTLTCTLHFQPLM
jgi:hypothetical protein